MSLDQQSNKRAIDLEAMLIDEDAGGSKKIQALKDSLTLRDINLKIPKGSFTCIIGDVGSGKSSLLSTLIGDLKYLSTGFMAVHGDELVVDDAADLRLKVNLEALREYWPAYPITLKGSVSYTQQVPWI